MIYWSLLLHFYQPPTQTHSILNKVCEESYRPLLNVFRDNPNARVTVNINGVLTEMLAEHGKPDILSGLAELAEKRQIEFTGSGKYHPILPLIPREEIIRQIAGNHETNKKFIGRNYRPLGFFPPEMCYGESIVEPVLNAGYEWAIMGGIACSVQWPLDIIHYIQAPAGRLSVIFRDDVLSNRISFKEIDSMGFLKHLVVFGEGKENIYVVTAMDAETFGHHIKNWEKDFLDAVFQSLQSEDSDYKQVLRSAGKPDAESIDGAAELITPVTISELLEHFKKGRDIEPKASSWSTTDNDIKAKNPYPLWDSPDNEVQKLLWEHLNLTIEMTGSARNFADNENSRKYAANARELLDPALHSDQFWWASKRPHWDVNMINRGVMLQQECLLNAYAALRVSGKVDDKEKQGYRYKRLASEDIIARLHRELFEG